MFKFQQENEGKFPLTLESFCGKSRLNTTRVGLCVAISWFCNFNEQSAAIKFKNPEEVYILRVFMIEKVD